MKTNIKHLIALFIILLTASEIQAQYGNGGGLNGRGVNGRGVNGRRGGQGYGRQRSTIPQAQTPPQEVVPKTAAQIVDAEMPSIVASLELDPFEEAILSTTLKKYIQERIELQILKLPNDKMREAYEKITKKQGEELKAGLPIEKYDAFLALQKSGLSKAKKDLKKKEKKKKKKKKTKE